MQDTQNHKGLWFLPGFEEKAVSGTLDFSAAEGIDLDLIGSLTERRELQHEQNIILGITSNGKRITLYKCYRISSSFSTSGFESSKYDASYMFVGKHFKSEDELIFCQLTAGLSDFDLWLGIFGFSKMDYNQAGREFNIEYQQPADIQFNLTPEFDGKFEFLSTVPIGRRTAEATIKQNCDISIWPKKGSRKFKDIMDCFWEFWRFMTLSYFESPGIEELSLAVMLENDVNDDTDDKRDNDGNKDNILFLKLYFQTQTGQSQRRNKRSRSLYLFTYDDIKTNFEKIIRKWYETGQIASPTVYALIESYSRREQPVEFKFLNLAHAIETFHRRTLDSKEMTKEAYAEKLQKIIAAVDPEYQDWLKSKLEFSNEVSLHKRLEELLQMIPAEIKLILLKPSEKDFIKIFKKNRNYYTHYDETLARKALYGADLLEFSERLKILLTCIILKALEFSDEQIVEIIFRKGVMLFNHIIPYQEVQTYLNANRNKTHESL